MQTLVLMAAVLIGAAAFSYLVAWILVELFEGPEEEPREDWWE